MTFYKAFLCADFYATKMMPSQMEVAPLHRTVDIRQKRRLLKNTKETKKILEG